MIRRVLHFMLIAFLTIGIVGTGYWGYQEHQDKNSILIKAENNYQRAFHNLNNNISNLEDELGKSIAMNSRKLLAPCMANIWRLASHARSNLGQLPLMLLPFNETEKFIAQIADFTYEIGMRDLDNEPITDEEWKQLKSLHAEAKEIQAELRKIQTKVLDENLRWMDVEMAIASEDKDMGKGIIQGIEVIDRQVQGYIETEFGSTDNKHFGKNDDGKEDIKGKSINEEQAKEKVREFLNLKSDTAIELEEAVNTDNYYSYSFNVKPPDRENEISIEVSKKGGHVLWLLDSRDIEESSISLNEAQNKAEAFLKNRGITSMVAVESNQYDNVGVFDFVYSKNNVLVYTDLVRVKVALDNGDITGYEAVDYVLAHDPKREIPKPKITFEQVKAKVNKNFNIHEHRLSMIELKAGEVKLCYELLGTIEEETFKIFVNALTGDEERVEKMKVAEPLF